MDWNATNWASRVTDRDTNHRAAPFIGGADGYESGSTRRSTNNSHLLFMPSILCCRHWSSMVYSSFVAWFRRQSSSRIKQQVNNSTCTLFLIQCPSMSPCQFSPKTVRFQFLVPYRNCVEQTAHVPDTVGTSLSRIFPSDVPRPRMCLQLVTKHFDNAQSTKMCVCVWTQA